MRTAAKGMRSSWARVRRSSHSCSARYGQQDLLELLPLHRAQPEVREQRVALQVRALDEDRHHQREAGGAADDDDVAVFAGEDLAGVGGDAVARVEALADGAEVGVHGAVVFVGAAERFEDRDVDVLAGAGCGAVFERGEDGDPGVQGAEVVGRFAAGAERLFVGVAGDVHQAGESHAGERVAFEAAVGTGLAEGCDGAVDEVRKLGLQVVVAEAERREAAGSFAFDEDVGVGEQFAEDDAAALRLDVKRQALLVGVEVEEEAALVGVGDVAREGAEAAGVVALRRLDLDDLRAEVGEEARGVGAGDALGEVDDAGAFEGEVGQGRASSECGEMMLCEADDSRDGEEWIVVVIRGEMELGVSGLGGAKGLWRRRCSSRQSCSGHRRRGRGSGRCCRKKARHWRRRWCWRGRMPICVKLTPSVERSSLKPVSFVALSVQARFILPAAGVAVRFVGAAGAGRVVAEAVFE